MNGRRALGAAVLLVAGIVVLLAGAAQGSRAQVRPALPENGPLTVMTDDSQSEYIATLSSRGRLNVLYRPPHPGCCELVSLAWSPNGRTLAYSRTCGGGCPVPEELGIHILDAATGKDRNLFQRDEGWDADLAWSPNGSRLAYVHGSIHLMKVDGSGDTLLHTGTDGWDSSPAWSPSGTRLAFDTTELSVPGCSVHDCGARHSVSVIDVNGSNRRLLVAHASAPAWSPNGRRIAVRAGCGVKLFTPAGKNVTPHRRPCGAIGRPGRPVWSPDGRKIAIQATSWIYVMNADGSGLHRVTTVTGRGMWKTGRPAWRPRKREPDSRLAASLVAVKSDLPPQLSYWGSFDETWLSQCLHRTLAVTAWSFSSLGSPHQGLDSVASVLTTRAKAAQYHRTAVRAVPGCARRRWVDGPIAHGKVHRLAFRHFGTQSAAWRLPFPPTYGPEARLKNTGMNALAQHLALLGVVTTGVGAAMLRMGVTKGLLEARQHRRCPACGRLMRTPVCRVCVD